MAIPLFISPDANRQQAADITQRTGATRTHTRPTNGNYLELSAAGLALCHSNHPKQRLRVDFIAGRQGFRRLQQGQAREAIVRACAVGKTSDSHIIDATAGLGHDAFVLASYGANVTMLERSPVVAALLNDGLQRARLEGAGEITARLTLIQADAATWLRNAQWPAAEVIYLDPMYRPTRRKAAATKSLAMLEELLKLQIPNDDELLITALPAASKRVVVKRQRFAPALGETTPSFTLTGRSTRFDVYIPG